jgi:cytoskeletal protein CcmA (bactofilin family)
MWGGTKKQRVEKVDTLLGERTELAGDIYFTGGLHVDGRVKGNIISESDEAALLVLSEKGSIEGEVRVPHIMVNGMVIGDIYARASVELAPNARITGNVYYNRIEIAMGAEVNGNLVHLDEASKPIASLSHDRQGVPETGGKLD